jgi:hypothetical protein
MDAENKSGLQSPFLVTRGSETRRSPRHRNVRLLIPLLAASHSICRCGRAPLASDSPYRMHARLFAVAAFLDPQNAETVLLIVVLNVLDEARQHPG